MICFKTDQFKGGLVMGIIIGIMYIAAIAIGKVQPFLIMSILSIVILFTFPISMGIQRKRSLLHGSEFGFWKAYRYSYSIMFIGYVTITAMFSVSLLFFSSEALPELVIRVLMSTKIPLTQEAIESIGSLYYGYTWVPYALVKIVVQPAIFAILPALIIKRKRR